MNKINFTGRIDIPNNLVQAEILQNEGKLILDLKMDLTSFGIDPKCSIVLDLRSAGTLETHRFDLGLLGIGVTRLEIDISHMRDPLSSRLRLKVIDKSTDYHIIRAQIDNFIPRIPHDDFELDQAKSLLKIVKENDLECPWLLKFDSGEPIIKVSGKRDMFPILQENLNLFVPLIISDVVRQIMVWLLLSDEFENEEIAEKWKQYFVLLGLDYETFSNQSDSELRKNNSEIYTFASDIANTFALKHELILKLQSELTKELQ
jgi:hypothetical protein